MEEIQSLLTAIQLQLEDLDDLCPNIKGKSKVPCDEEIAIAHFKLDLIAFKAQMEDLRQAESIKIAQETDAELLEEFQRLDVLERQDHEYAEHLSMNAEVMMTPIRIPTPIPISTPTSTSSKNVRINAAAGPSCVSESSSDSATDMRSFELTPDEYADIPEYQEASKPECASCMELEETLHKMEHCDHFFCTECMCRLFSLAAKDESLLPVSCCGEPVDLQLARQILQPEELESFMNAVLEHAATRKVYCPVPTCSKFIPITDDEPSGVIRCSACSCEICLNCKQRAHDTVDCPEDGDTQSFTAYAQSQGWQRCRRCHKYVELTHGCYHMTCVCSFQFCYLCGSKWKECECRQWDEARLTAIALERVQIQQPNLHGDRLQTAVRVFADRLRVNHECRHEWGYQKLRRVRQCENCNFDMGVYCYRCHECLIDVCHTCRYHRIRQRFR